MKQVAMFHIRYCDIWLSGNGFLKFLATKPQAAAAMPN
jgi:hypothetical protein